MLRRISTGAACATTRCRALPPALLLAAAMLAGCTEPRGPGFAASPAVAAAPRPALAETAALRRAQTETAPRAEPLAAAGDALAARAAALGARAAGLAGPVVDPARRDRLIAAAGRAAAQP